MAPITGESRGSQPNRKKTLGKVYGQSIDDFYALWKTEMTQKYQQEAKRIKAKGLTNSSAITPGGISYRKPVPLARRAMDRLPRIQR